MGGLALMLYQGAGSVAISWREEMKQAGEGLKLACLTICQVSSSPRGIKVGNVKGIFGI